MLIWCPERGILSQARCKCGVRKWPHINNLLWPFVIVHVTQLHTHTHKQRDTRAQVHADASFLSAYSPRTFISLSICFFFFFLLLSFFFFLFWRLCRWKDLFPSSSVSEFNMQLFYWKTIARACVNPDRNISVSASNPIRPGRAIYHRKSRAFQPSFYYFNIFLSY